MPLNIFNRKKIESPNPLNAGKVITPPESKEQMIAEIKKACEEPVVNAPDVLKEPKVSPENDEESEEIEPDEFEEIKQKSEEELIAEVKAGVEAELIGFELGMYGFEYKIRTQNLFFKIGPCKLSQE